MQTVRTVLLAGATAALFSAGVAGAKNPQTHIMTIRLPSGAIEEIRYAGNVAPRVEVTDDEMPVAFGWPAAFFGPDSAFAEFDRISAQMNQQMDAMLREARTLAAQPGLVTEINAGKLPSGSQSYSFVSTMSGNGVCEKSVEITSRGDGQKRQVVSKTYGDCGKNHGAGVNNFAPAASQPSEVREIRYDSHAPAPKVYEASAF